MGGGECIFCPGGKGMCNQKDFSKKNLHLGTSHAMP